MPLTRDLPDAIGVNFLAFRHVYLEYKNLQSSRRERLSRRIQHTKGSIKWYLYLKKIQSLYLWRVRVRSTDCESG